MIKVPHADSAAVLANQPFISEKAAMMQLFREFERQCEMLLRPGDDFPRIDPNEMGAGAKVVQRLRFLERREQASPPAPAPKGVKVELTAEQQATALRRMAWDHFPSDRAQLESLIGSDTTDAAEFLGLKPSDLSRIEIRTAFPPDDWDMAVADRIRMALKQWHDMSPTRRAIIPAVMAERRMKAEKASVQERLAALEETVHALVRRIDELTPRPPDLAAQPFLFSQKH